MRATALTPGHLLDLAVQSDLFELEGAGEGLMLAALPSLQLVMRECTLRRLS